MSSIVQFARDELGITLRPRQAEAIEEFEQGDYEQAIWRLGRRAGKSMMADVLVLADAVLRDHLRQYLRPGEPRIAGIVCPRLDQAMTHIASIASMVEQSPRLRRLLIGRTTEELAFSNGSVVKAFPCSARGLRGGAWSCAVLDELGHFISTEDGNAAGDAVLDAVAPSLAQFGEEGWLIAISTPRWRQGAFHALCERAESGRFPYIHSLHASTREMNPAISIRWLEQKRTEDPDLFAREFEARWIDGASSYLPSAEVVAAVRHGINRLAPVPDIRYVGSLDPGHQHDAFAMAVAHLEPEYGRVICDGVWSWHRAGHEASLDAVAEVAKAYGIVKVTSDQHAPVPIREGLAKRGLQMDYRPWDNAMKADAFSAVKIRLNTSALELPDDQPLISELCSLEARPTPSGLTRIAAAGSGSDDLATALAAAVHQLAVPRKKAPTSWRYSGHRHAPAWSGVGDPGPDPDDRSTVRWGGWGQAL
jgi:hypothetical protein